MNDQISSFGPLITPEPLTWSQDRRLKFIDFRLRWEGRVNRTDLVDFFQISPQQATIDLSKYQEGAPDNLQYDPRQKAYVRTRYFHPQYRRSSSSTYLNELLSLSSRAMEPSGCFVGWQPPLATVPTPGRKVDGSTLMAVVQAIKERRQLLVEYQTMGRAMPTARSLSPHAIATDGLRWHVRAYCHTKESFRDFVMGRLKPLEIGAPSTISHEQDIQWNTLVRLELAPHPGLPPASRAALEIDYGMEGGVVALDCRHAMLLYTLIRLGLLEENPNPVVQQIVLRNQVAVAPYLKELGYSGPQERLFE